MLRFIKLLVALVLVISGEASPRRDHSTPRKALDDTQYRLSGDVLPVNYALDLTLDKDFATTKIFSGMVTIQITIKKVTKIFQIHMRDIEINSDVVFKDKGGTEIAVTAAGPDAVTDFFTVTSADNDLQPGDYSLTISYTGHLSDTDMEGFYLSSYKDSDGKDKYLATTFFEEVGARRAFPCFDEPAMKATFDVSISYPDGYNAMSNTKGSNPQLADDLQKVTFPQTPKMSTYLVAFIVSEFSCTDGESFEQTPTQVCSRIGTEDTRATALSTAPEALQAIHDYIGIPFSADIGKLSLAAIPDFEIGAMENWGMVTFREADLLWDEAQSSNAYKQFVVTAVTHELSHQWFGDQTSLSWWSDVFLNEGFATFFQYYATDVNHPDWELTKQFVVEQLQTALLADSMDSSLPLHYDVSDPDTIKGRFDDISYNKGGSILRMVYHVLGLRNFKLGLNGYLLKNSVVTPEILWAAFQYTSGNVPDTVSVIMDTWTNKPGYPVLTVTWNGDDLVISQEAFVMSGEAPDTKWYVPISYTLSSETGDFAETTPKEWLRPNEDLTVEGVMKNQEWIILNNQETGYYRVNYDTTLWTNIAIALNAEDFSNIDEISRSQIADDLLNLGRADKLKYTKVLTVLQFLKNDDSYYSWSSAFNGFNYLLQRVVDENVREDLTTYITDLMQTLYKSTPIGEEKTDDQIYTLKQVLALTWACKFNMKDCVDFAKQKFVDYRSDATKIPTPNMKSIVYCNGLRNSEDAKTDYDFLWGQYIGSSLWTEKVTMLKALGCSNDAAVRAEYLATALSEDVKIQDATYVFSSVYSNNPEGVDDVLDFIQDQYESFNTRFGDNSVLNSLISTVSDLLTTQAQIDKLTEFSNTEGLPTDIKASATSGVATATTNLAITKDLEKRLNEYFHPPSTTTSSSTTTISTTTTSTTTTSTKTTPTTTTPTTTTPTTTTPTTANRTTTTPTTTIRTTTTPATIFPTTLPPNRGSASINSYHFINVVFVLVGYILHTFY